MPLAASCKLLVDLPTLQAIGFTGEPTRFKKSSAPLDAELEAGNALTCTAFDIVVGILHFRSVSMSWHCTWSDMLAMVGQPPSTQTASLQAHA